MPVHLDMTKARRHHSVSIANVKDNVKLDLKRNAALIVLSIASSSLFAQPLRDGGTEFKTSYCAKPTYPVEARRAGAEGRTLVSYTVDAEGLVREAKVLKPSGESKAHQALDSLALRAVRACRFRGAVGHGMGTIEFEWALTD